MPKVAQTRIKKILSNFFGFILLSCSLDGYASGPNLRINEISSGTNGNSKVQFIEIVAESEADKQWGPGPSEVVGRVILTFFGLSGAQTGRYVFGSDAPPGQNTVLIATKDFVLDNDLVVPDFIIPPLVPVNSGKVCVSSNADNPVYSFQQCVAYGGAGYKGETNGVPTNANTVSSLNRSSLSLFRAFDSYDVVASDFEMRTETPSGTQSLGESNSLEQNEFNSSVSQFISSEQIQGRNLFFNETFSGNGRTCSSCHFESDAFGLNPETVSKLPADDPLFVHENNVNTLVIDGAGSVNPTASSAQPSDLRVGDVITGSLGGSATVLSGTGNTYLIVGGADLDKQNNVIQDSHGNSGTLRSLVLGDLNGPGPNGDRFGLESSYHLRGPRALIVTNVNGFEHPANLRGVPSLLGAKSGRSTGQSGSINNQPLTRDEFNTIAVRQHLTKSLDRREQIDFRIPIEPELDALDAFIEGLLPQIFDDPPPNIFGHFGDAGIEFFAYTQQQRRGLQIFSSRCAGCHRSITGAGTASEINTQVATLDINRVDNIPTEQELGAAPNTRQFRTRNLINLDKSAPYFHDNSVATLEDAIRFYETDNFLGNNNILRLFDKDQNVVDVASLLRNIKPQPFRVSTRGLRFGEINIDKGSSPPQTFELINTSDAAISVSNIRLVQDLSPLSSFDTRLDYSFSHDLVESNLIESGESLSFQLTFNPDDSNTHQFTSNASIEFELTQGDEQYEAGVLLKGGRGRVLDPDNDGVDYPLDNCETKYNPSQSNIDNDRFGDVCDSDLDGDDIGNDIDVCRFVADPDQRDLDLDGLGDACDSDDDGDGIPDTWEIRYGLNSRLYEDALLDIDQDGFTNLEEFKFSTNPTKLNKDDNQNGIPDITDRRLKGLKIVPIILSILTD